jgi:hypothetical protein
MFSAIVAVFGSRASRWLLRAVLGAARLLSIALASLAPPAATAMPPLTRPPAAPATRPPTTPTPVGRAARPAAGNSPARPGPVHVGDARYALVTVVRRVGECSNLGGNHYLLEVAAPGPSDPHLVEFGDHGWYGELEVGKAFLAELAPPGPSWFQRRAGLDMWCTWDLHVADGEALRVLDAPGDPAVALAQVAAHGWPAGPEVTPYFGGDRHGPMRDR